MTALQVKAEASAGMRRGAHRTTGRGRLFSSSPSGGCFSLAAACSTTAAHSVILPGTVPVLSPSAPECPWPAKTTSVSFRRTGKPLFALAAYALYFLWWYLTAYGLGSDAPENYRYTLGMPDWFFYSCVLGYPVACLLVWGLVRFFSSRTCRLALTKTRRHRKGLPQEKAVPAGRNVHDGCCLHTDPHRPVSGTVLCGGPVGRQALPQARERLGLPLRNIFWAAVPWAALCWP